MWCKGAHSAEQVPGLISYTGVTRGGDFYAVSVSQVAAALSKRSVCSYMVMALTPSHLHIIMKNSSEVSPKSQNLQSLGLYIHAGCLVTECTMLALFPGLKKE